MVCAKPLLTSRCIVTTDLHCLVDDDDLVDHRVVHCLQRLDLSDLPCAKLSGGHLLVCGWELGLTT